MPACEIFDLNDIARERAPSVALPYRRLRRRRGFLRSRETPCVIMLMPSRRRIEKAMMKPTLPISDFHAAWSQGQARVTTRMKRQCHAFYKQILKSGFKYLRRRSVTIMMPKRALKLCYFINAFARFLSSWPAPLSCFNHIISRQTKMPSARQHMLSHEMRYLMKRRVYYWRPPKRD